MSVLILAIYEVQSLILLTISRYKHKTSTLFTLSDSDGDSPYHPRGIRTVVCIRDAPRVGCVQPVQLDVVALLPWASC